MFIVLCLRCTTRPFLLCPKFKAVLQNRLWSVSVIAFDCYFPNWFSSLYRNFDFSQYFHIFIYYKFKIYLLNAMCLFARMENYLCAFGFYFHLNFSANSIYSNGKICFAFFLLLRLFGFLSHSLSLSLAGISTYSMNAIVFRHINASIVWQCGMNISRSKKHSSK